MFKYIFLWTSDIWGASSPCQLEVSSTEDGSLSWGSTEDNDNDKPRAWRVFRLTHWSLVNVYCVLLEQIWSCPAAEPTEAVEQNTDMNLAIRCIPGHSQCVPSCNITKTMFMKYHLPWWSNGRHKQDCMPEAGVYYSNSCCHRVELFFNISLKSISFRGQH